MPSTATHSEHSPWPHRWAILLACATFPLLWVGGLVTTTDSGMAVPDWPTTYGYNLFLYPWKSWITGPSALFLEHSHRLIGATVGMISVGLLTVLWRKESRRWIRWLGLLALALVIIQGILGGMRVLLDERTLAMLHGITGPFFFALTVALVVFTSSRWRNAGRYTPSQEPGRRGWHNHLRRLAIVTCILVYLQIVLGAVIRHVPIATEPATFALAVRFHLFLAAVLTLHIVALVWPILRHHRSARPLATLALTLTSLLLLQIALGAGTWVVKFAAPAWAPQWINAGRAAIQDGGWLQTHIITAHVATGSLLLATSLALALYAQRLLPALATCPAASRRREALR